MRACGGGAAATVGNVRRAGRGRISTTRAISRRRRSCDLDARHIAGLSSYAREDGVAPGTSMSVR